MRSKKTIIIYLLLIAISTIPGLWLCLIPYDEFCRLLLIKSNKLYRLAEFQSRYLTPTRFELLRAAALALPFLIWGTFYFALKNAAVSKLFANAFSSIRTLIDESTSVLTDLSTAERIVAGSLFFVVAVRTFYFAAFSPIKSDEAWTYLHFASRGLPAAMSLNYSPNNHILYSILANITYYLPFDSTFDLRLPSVLITLATGLLFFVFIRRRFSFSTAIVSTALLISIYPFLYYSVQARGYILSTFLFAASYFALLAIFANRRRVLWAVFTVGAILGAYTVPSFLYPFLSLSIFAFVYFLFNKRFDDIKWLMLSGAIVGTGVLILYLPVFAMSGVSSVVSNEYVRSLDRMFVFRALPDYCSKIFEWLFGNIYLGLIILVAPFLKAGKNSLIVRLSFVCLLSVPVFCLVHSVLPFERVWTYLAISVAATCAIPIENIAGKWRLDLWTAGLIAMTILGLGEYNYQTRINVDEYELRALKASKYMAFLKNEELRKFYVEEDMTSIYVDYFLTTHRRNYAITYGYEQPFDVGQSYDCIILKNGNSLADGLQGYRLVYTDDLSKIFVR